MSGGGSSGKVEITEQERGLAEVGAAKWNDYQQRFVPVENAVMEQIAATKDKAEAVSGIANADAMQAGGSPSSAASLKGLVDAYDRQGRILSNAVPKAESSVQDTSMQGMLKLAAYGRGLSDQASLSSYKAGANLTQAAIASARADQQANADTQQAWGTAAGMATRGGLSAWDSYKKANP